MHRKDSQISALSRVPVIPEKDSSLKPKQITCVNDSTKNRKLELRQSAGNDIF